MPMVHKNPLLLSFFADCFYHSHGKPRTLLRVQSTTCKILLNFFVSCFVFLILYEL